MPRLCGTIRAKLVVWNDSCQGFIALLVPSMFDMTRVKAVLHDSCLHIMTVLSLHSTTRAKIVWNDSCHGFIARLVRRLYGTTRTKSV